MFKMPEKKRKQRGAKKRNPSDLTKRNNDARKKVEATLEARIKELELSSAALERAVRRLESHITKFLCGNP